MLKTVAHDLRLRNSAAPLPGEQFYDPRTGCVYEVIEQPELCPVSWVDARKPARFRSPRRARRVRRTAARAGPSSGSEPPSDPPRRLTAPRPAARDRRRVSKHPPASAGVRRTTP
jgi:hypothetical protein